MLKGYRTYLIAAALAAVTLAEQLGYVDASLAGTLRGLLGAGAGRVWDDAPNQDQLHGPYVTGYVGVRNRIRSMMAELP